MHGMEEIKKLIAKVTPYLGNCSNISKLFLWCLREEVINKDQYLALQAAFIVKKYTRTIENQFKHLKCEICLYDKMNMSVWDTEEENEDAYEIYDNETISSCAQFYCALPSKVGHMVLYSDKIKSFSSQEVSMYTIYANSLGEELVSIKDQPL
ncbi:hypothetical protein [Paenibacillus eucommiae]|uniref:Uncharacterized protein n=1 Tax=Paenibacillus eucommiae TaxID=1355755 RepID=A0ABS4IRV0_9BACL|nr:hypothetical protein [Paenibacillus eucommiae]MBP1990303.1 hypothetical protein [Paenibacillus eucommiae]